MLGGAAGINADPVRLLGDISKNMNDPVSETCPSPMTRCGRRRRRLPIIPFARSAACRLRIGDMADHLLDHVRPHLDHSTEKRIAYIQPPRWIGHQVAVTAHGLAVLASRCAGADSRAIRLASGCGLICDHAKEESGVRSMGRS